MKSESVPETKLVCRMITLISTCKSAAYELFTFVVGTNFKVIRKWMQNTEKASPTNGTQSKVYSKISLSYLYCIWRHSSQVYIPQFPYLSNFIGNSYTDVRKALISLIEKLIVVVNNDYKKELNPPPQPTTQRSASLNKDKSSFVQ